VNLCASACPAVPCEICDSNSKAHFTGVGPEDRTGAVKFKMNSKALSDIVNGEIAIQLPS